MGERKVLIRYIPPDFDPSIIPKFKRDKNRICEVRTMIPFSLRCSTCGEYMGRGKKFNSRKEMCEETYMGIRIFRFLIKCSVCSAQISFKTDPKNSDYEVEYGATRNYEVWKDNEAALESDQKQQEEEEKMDAMKALENRTLDSKHEMDILDALDETMAINRRHQRVDTDSILSKRSSSLRSDELTAENEALVESFRLSRSKGEQKSKELPPDKLDVAPPQSSAMSIADKITSQIASKNSIEDAGRKIVKTKIIPKKRKAEEMGEFSEKCSVKKKDDAASSVEAPAGPSPSASACFVSGPVSLLASYGSSDED